MEPFAYPPDVAAIWRPLGEDEIGQVTARIAQASRLLRDEVPDVGGFSLDERIDNGSLERATVRDVVVGMVHRVMLNPEGLRQESTGPFGRTFDTAISSGEMTITKREMDRLTGRKSTGSKAGTIKPGPGPVFTRYSGARW